LRRTALTKATGPALTTRRARSTVAETAACGGIRVRSSWCAPRRSTSRTGGSTCFSGRSTHAWSTASYSPCPRSAPYASSVASAASRPVMPRSRSSPGSTRLA
jgi:hypothetical protein